MEIGRTAVRCLRWRTRFTRCAKGQKRPEALVLVWVTSADAESEHVVATVALDRVHTYVEMISILLRRELSPLFDYSMPAIVCTVLVYNLCHGGEACVVQ
jgi:hypothetical protein